MTTVLDLMVAQLALGDYAPIRRAYRDEITGVMRGYLITPDVKVTKYANQFKRSMNESFLLAFEQGMKDGSGDEKAGVEPEDQGWYNSRVREEIAHIDTLFQQLKTLKEQAKEEGIGIFEGVPEERAEGYARTLDGIYSQGKIRGAKNKMLTFGGNDGQESCRTCQKLKGQRHRASWWKAHDLIPYRGNGNLQCGGWQCEHFLYDDDGNLYTV